MRALALVLIFLLAATATNRVVAATDSAAAMADLETVYIMRVDGWITIDTGGKVAEFQRDTDVPEGLKAPIERAVRSWLFEPVVENGAPVQAKAKTRITLSAQKEGDVFHVKVDNVTFPLAKGERATEENGQPFAYSPKSLTPPSYPDGLLRSGIEGTVLLGLKFGDDGQVENCVAIQTALLNVYGKPKYLAAAIRTFESSALAGVKKWRFNVDTSHGVPDPAHRSATITVSYWIHHEPGSVTGKWELQSRSARQDMPWQAKDSSSQRVGVSDSNGGEMIPATTPFHLLSNPIGKGL